MPDGDLTLRQKRMRVWVLGEERRQKRCLEEEAWAQLLASASALARPMPYFQRELLRKDLEAAIQTAYGIPGRDGEPLPLAIDVS